MSLSAVAPMCRLHPIAAGDALPATVPVRGMLRSWGLQPVRIRHLGGTRNVHWSVVAREGRFVLRCYRLDRNRAAIAYEFRVLDAMRQAGWPVACPIAELRTWQGRMFALFPALPGRVHDWRRDRRRAREAGVLLAALHADLGRLVTAQRSNWCATDEAMRAEVEELVDRAAVRLDARPGLRDPIVRHSCATYEALAEVPPDLPRLVVHGDFVPWNLRWEGKRLSAVLDFDDIRLDLRAADVAAARRRGLDAVVSGYDSRTPLDEREVALLAPLWRACMLHYATELLRAPELSGRVLAELDWCVQEMESTADFGHSARM
ncbi:phosphotransferase enzyme family protein [Dactylosporangium sp. CA-139066]|uniref:phosphotransferase enzyme family protein n=1 Tax=Dactylosporangium sp. CA-139066 TaxID=3239930 RepID=UPI003D92B0D9